MKTITLKEQYTLYKEAHPKARIRDISIALGVSEMELLEVAEVEQLTYLGNNFKAVLKEVHAMGHVMALTRNEHGVHETKGVYENVSFMEKAPMGIAHNPIIDLRYFLSNWAHVYAAVFQSGKRVMHSLQFFDKYGNAVHKIYATPKSNLDAYHALVEKYTTGNRMQVPMEVEKVEPSAKTDTALDIGAFQTAWLNMKDTHDFFGLLRKYNLTRQAAFCIAPEGTTYRVQKNAIVDMLEMAVATGTPIMVFLGNKSCLQIFSGNIHKVVEMNGWYNVLDKDFNLHLKLDAIDEAWVVKKYTTDGIVTSLELFDKEGNQILYCFGQRKPGIPELDMWRKIVAKLTPLTT
ncbi:MULTISPECIES: hemin-degrading factor [unclassified Aureispira]|uniref:hemin-degrading factor n=1 Tax=unclassified Aureispira TaxID=2649989 RepID=UPI000695B59D|nr:MULTISPECIES: hemin-degrading factor [unclassified Aureispira]WMX13987.1 hemin-degrading factor [Aureispira sp. CCB-E]